MLAPWEMDARLEGLPEDLIQVVATRLRDYDRLSPASRRESLDGLWKRIQREAAEEVQDLDFLPVSAGEAASTASQAQPPKHKPSPSPCPIPTPPVAVEPAGAPP